jgi:hypothetical protein
VRIRPGFAEQLQKLADDRCDGDFTEAVHVALAWSTVLSEK